MSALVSCLLCAVILWFGTNTGVRAQTASTTQPTPARYALLLRELAQASEKRAALEHRAQQYKEAYTAIQQQLAEKRAACTCYNSSSIAFTAHLDKDVTVLGVDQPLPFDNVTVNLGNGYDARHSQFRAPISGTYSFHVSLSTLTGYQLAAEIMLNGKTVVKIRTGNINAVNSATTAIAVHMAAGDDVWVQHDHTEADSNRLYQGEGLLTSFSGHLVARD